MLYILEKDKTRQLYFTRVAQSAARLVSLGALSNRIIPIIHALRYTFVDLSS